MEVLKKLNRTGVIYLILIIVFFSIADPVQPRLQRIQWLYNVGQNYPIYLSMGKAGYHKNLLWRARQYHLEIIKFINDIKQTQDNKELIRLKKAISYANIGFCYNYLFRIDLAAAYYQKALDIKDDISGYYMNLGLIEYNRKNFTRAIDILNKGIAVNIKERNFISDKRPQYLSTNQKILENIKRFLIFAYDARGEYANNVEAINQWLPSADSNEKILFNFYAGKSAARLGEYALAVNYLNQCLELAPWHAEAYRELAMCFTKLNQQALADQMNQKAGDFQSSPEFLKYQDSLSLQPMLFLGF